MPSRFVKSALLLAMFGATACSSTTLQRVVSINPSDASLYINGEYVGKGDRRPRDFNFAQVERIYVQAVHPDYQPVTEWFTMRDLERMAATDTDLKITMRQR